MKRRFFSILTACTSVAWLPAHSANAGTLIGSQSSAPAVANLTSEGTRDWAHWGLTRNTDFNHKTSGANQISDVTTTGNVDQFDDAATGFLWNDGNPQPSIPFTTTGILIPGLSRQQNRTNGFQFTVTADATPKVVKVYAGAWNAKIRFEARLSDGSAAPYIDENLDDTGFGSSVVYTVRFAANGPGQTLTIRVYSIALHDPDGNCALMAATLGTPFTGTGALSSRGSFLPSGEIINLTQEGTLDWAHWANDFDFTHKAGIDPKISALTLIGVGFTTEIGTIPAVYQWTDGEPIPDASTSAGISAAGQGSGFEFTVPADTSPRVLRVYVNAYSARVLFEASLSDGSAVPISDGSYDATPSQQGPVRVYTVRFAAGTAGQTLTVRCTTLVDQGGGWVSLHAATLRPAPPQNGILGGGHTVLAVASTVDLTDEGRIDWAHWGLNEPADLDRKIGGSNAISNFKVIGLNNAGGPLEVQWFGDNFTAYSWTDGTPTASASSTGSGVWLAEAGTSDGPGLNTGFEISVPADTSVRALKVYVGAYASRMHFEAALSDDSAPPFVDESFANESDGPNRVYTLTFAAGSAGQKLIVRWWNASLNDQFANVTLQSAVLREAAPIVSLVTPANTSIFNPASAGLRFTASTIDPFSVPANQLGLELNGVNLSSQLAVSGSPTARSALYASLKPNTFYTGRISAADNFGRGTTNFITFDTFSTNGAVVIEIEDYNYGSGQFIDNPTPGAFADLASVANVDYYTAGSAFNEYRPTEPLEVFEALETRPYFIEADMPNYAMSSLNVDDWLNYTRTFANGTYQVFLRYGAGVDQSLRLDLVTGDRTQPNQLLSPIGMLNAPEINTTAIYRYTGLTDSNGTPITVHLSGVQTLRLTGSDVHPEVLVADFFILVPTVGPPRLTISRGPALVTLSFPTETGRTYTLQFKNALTDSAWQNILPAINGDGTTKSINQPATLSSRFYRLSVQ